MSQGTLRIGVLGAGNWARRAHIPGWQRDGRAHVAVVCDVEPERARELATRFDVPEATDDWQAVVTRPDLDVIDVVTPSHTPLRARLGGASRPASTSSARSRWPTTSARPAARGGVGAAPKGLKTKLGFTFRYSPGVQYAKSLIDEGFVGMPFIFNGYEQNSQWLDPKIRSARSTTPPTSRGSTPPRSKAMARRSSTSATGGSAPTYTQRGRHDAQLHPRADGARHRPDDAHEHRRRRHLHGRVRQWRDRLDPDQLCDDRQLPGHRGAASTASRGAIICRLVEEFGVAETIKVATPGRGRVQAERRSRSASTRPAATRASRGAACSTPT